MSNKKENNALDKTSEDKGNALTRRDTEIGFSLEPKNLQEALKICEYLSESSMVPKQYQGNPADILVAINFGQEVGLKPLQSLNSVAVINGSPGLWGDAPLALCKQHNEFEFILEDNEAFAYARDNIKGWEHLKNVNKDDTSICVVKRKGEPPVVREFSKEDVKTAKLGNVHNTYPKTMRRYRARGPALRAAFPDVLKGFDQAEIHEETQKMIDAGIYDDLTTRTEVPEQPLENRQPIDTDLSDDNGFKYGDASMPDSSGENDAPQGQKPDSELLTEVNKLGRGLYKSDWYSKSKEMSNEINPDASSLLDLSDDEMQELVLWLEELKAESKGETV